MIYFKATEWTPNLVRFFTVMLFYALVYSPEGFRAMNFCDDLHIYDNFDDLYPWMTFPMVDDTPKPLEQKPVLARIVSHDSPKMFNICVQKYNLVRTSKNSDSEYRDFMFMQG